MKRSALFVCVVLGLAGCGKKTESDATKQPTKEAAPAVAPAPPPEPVAKPSAGYDIHMKAGDALENQKKWSEALAEFELALAAKPDDAKALGEVGFTAFHAGKLARAKEASEAAVVATKDPKQRGSALFNLGLAVEGTLPHAAASLYAASLAVRPNATVNARLASLVRNSPNLVREASADGSALLTRLHVDPIKLPPAHKPPTPVDSQLLDVIATTEVEWEGAAGKSVVSLHDVTCTESTSTKPHTFECDLGADMTGAKLPLLTGKDAKALVDNLVARKITGKSQAGKTVFAVASIQCTSRNEPMEDGRYEPDSCDVTK